MGKRRKRSKVTVQGVNNPVPAVSVGEITSHVPSRSSDCDPAVSGVDALAPTAVTATSAVYTTRIIVDGPVFQKNNALAKTGVNQSTADRTEVLGGDDLHLKVIGDSLERQSRELLDQLERLVPTVPPEDMLNNLTLTDDELDITVIPAESTRRSDDDMSTDGDVVEEVVNLGSQPQTSRNQSGPVSAPADTKLRRQIATESMDVDGEPRDDPSTATDSKSMTIEGESTEAPTIATDSESPACVGESKETSSTDTDADAISAKEASDTRHYKRAASYLRKFVGRDASSHTRREIMFIKSKLKYMRKFERIYPNAPRCELLVDKIFLPNPASASAKDSVETAATSKKVEVKPAASDSKVEPKAVPKPNPSQKGLEKDKGHNPTPNDSRKSSQLEKVTVPNPAPTPTNEGKADEQKVPKTCASHSGVTTGGSTGTPSTSEKTNKSSQSKTVKRVRSSEGPQPSPKKTMISQTVNTANSYAGVLAHKAKGSSTSTEKASTSSGKAVTKARERGRRKPYAKTATVANDDELLVAIIDRADPFGKISESHWLLFETRLRLAIVSTEANQGDRQFGGAFLHKGVKVIKCLNRSSQEYLKKTVNGFDELWEGAKIAAVSITEIPSRKVFPAWVPPPTVDKELLLRMLELQNPGFLTKDWTVMSLTPCKENGGMDIKMAVDSSGEEYLKIREGKLNFGSGWVRFRLSPPRGSQ
ncbi:uncharacterized protein [Musca autumnalis]|uniref:uncharacterized protein n=1 Tax=Musca autumnalis TaxID=221902 RepID=UPI003CF517B3